MTDGNGKEGEKSMADEPETTVEQSKPAKPPRVGALNTQKASRLYISKTIRRVERGEIDSKEGMRRIQMAHINSKVIEADVMEARLDRVEQRQKELDRRHDNQL